MPPVARRLGRMDEEDPLRPVTRRFVDLVVPTAEECESAPLEEDILIRRARGRVAPARLVDADDYDLARDVDILVVIQFQASDTIPYPQKTASAVSEKLSTSRGKLPTTSSPSCNAIPADFTVSSFSV